MSNASDGKRSEANANAIEIPFDLERPPREQIEAALASVKPRNCQRHPDESLAVDNKTTIRAALRHECPHNDERRCIAFASVFERCSTCPHTDIGAGIYVDECPIHAPSYGVRQSRALDEMGIPLPQLRATVSLEANRSVRDQFNAWLTQADTFRCPVGDQLLRRREAHIIPMFKTLTLEPEFASCPQCRLERLGISPDEAHASFEKFKIEPPAIRPHFEKCREFAASPNGVLLLLGNCGTGKTFLAIACLREQLKMGVSGLQFIKHRHFISKHRISLRAVPFGEEPLRSPLQDCQKADLLVYDELTASTDAYSHEDLLLDLFERRMGKYKPTIITANLSRDELESALGSRLLDRLRRAAFAVLEFGFESKRALHNSEYLERSQDYHNPNPS